MTSGMHLTAGTFGSNLFCTRFKFFEFGQVPSVLQVGDYMLKVSGEIKSTFGFYFPVSWTLDFVLKESFPL